MTAGGFGSTNNQQQKILLSPLTKENMSKSFNSVTGETYFLLQVLIELQCHDSRNLMNQ